MPNTTSNYKVIVDAEVSTAKIQSQLDAFTKNYKGIKFGDTSKTASSITSIYDGFRKINSIAGVIKDTVNIVKSLSSAVFELNESTIEFQKVSDLTGTALDNYIDKASKLGDTVARTTSEMVDAATEFRKSGYSDEDALTLAQISSEYQNVADSELSAGDAASYIISQMKAFNITAQDATSIIDKTNEVSNNFAVSSTDIIK